MVSSNLADDFGTADPSHWLRGAVIVFALVLSVRSMQSWMQKRPQKALLSQTPSKLEQPFITPLPEPLLDFDPDGKTPKPYRPFRHGPNHITMGIRKLDWNNWIEMDSYFLRYHDLKAAELKKDFDGHIKYVDRPATKDACFELYEELARFLTHRYPRIFNLTGGILSNSLTTEEFRFPARTPEEALSTAALLVQDDLAIMVENDDGQYHLDAGAVCLPGFWRLRQKFRMSLDTLHLEAGVPHYAAKLQRSMNKFMKALPADRPVERNNFFIQLDDGLHWSHRMGDQFGTDVAAWATADSNGLRIEDLHFRSERQTLRRLPRSRYKGKSHWESILLPYLDGQNAMQEKEGVLVEIPEGAFPY